MVQNMVLAVAAGYLLGALPFAHIASRIRGIDVFTTGSTLAGTANVFFNVGHRTGVLSWLETWPRARQRYSLPGTLAFLRP